MQALREFVPAAVDSDWELDVAGQRVQVIRRAKGSGGVLEFGTDGAVGRRRQHRRSARCLAGCVHRGACDARRHGALLSPTAIQSWLPKLKEMVPSLGTELSNEPALFEEVWSWGTEVLKLDKPANGGLRTAARGVRRRASPAAVSV